MKGKTTFCFGTGREGFSKVVIDRKKIIPDASMPGPGAYKPLRPIGENAKAFKLKFKLEYGDPT
jgi:hypothetical protein